VRRVLRRVGIGSIVVLAGLQLVPVERANPQVTGDLVGVPTPVAERLRQACYDCHSHETIWPWYARIAPVSFLLAHDVSEGREHLDFSTWTELGPRRQAKRLREVGEQVDEREMPPALYMLMHPDARLDDRARAELVAWARDAAERTLPARRPDPDGTTP
jgi:hypothetical protein